MKKIKIQISIELDLRIHLVLIMQSKEISRRSWEKKKIDILLNNAGTIENNLFQMSKIENIQKIFQINFFHR